MSFGKFLKSKVFLINLLLAVGITILLIAGTLKMISIYARHGESLPVPDLYNTAEAEYSSILKKNDLRYKISDSTYVEGMQPGSVIDQVPDAGHRVKRGRTVYLTINSSTPEQITIPRLTNISMRQSIALIEEAGLKQGNVIYEPSEFQNLVLKAQIGGRDIVPGAKANRGAFVDLYVGSGKAEGTVALPNLIGLTLETAQMVISESRLHIAAILYDETVSDRIDSLNARIWKQSPSPENTQVNINSSIDVWLSLNSDKIFIDNEAVERNDEMKSADDDPDFF